IGVNRTLDRGMVYEGSGPHPDYDLVVSCGGVQKIFDVFRKSTSAPLKNSAAVSIGYLFKAREINDTKIRKDAIAHLKKLAYEKIDFKHKARRSLIFLELNLMFSGGIV
ncbi:MAG: hypothetical protein EZS28_048044, partial [Streblomastix strix]